MFVGAVMENLLNDLIADPVYILGLAALAFLLCFGMFGMSSAMFGEYVFVNLPLSAEAIRLAPDAVPTLHRIICLRRCSLS